jgi:hypothetical protein
MIRGLVLAFVAGRPGIKKIKATSDAIYVCLVFQFQVAWMIYGNTL